MFNDSKKLVESVPRSILMVVFLQQTFDLRQHFFSFEEILQTFFYFSQVVGWVAKYGFLNWVKM